MVDRLLAPGTRGRERFGIAFVSAIVIGWTGASLAYFGTRWDARVDTENALLAHFLGWFLTAYTIGGAVGLSLVQGCGIRRHYLKVVGWILFGALIGGFLFVETTLAGTSIGLRGSGGVQLLLLVGGTVPWMIPLITGSIAFAAALKLDAKTESLATRD